MSLSFFSPIFPFLCLFPQTYSREERAGGRAGGGREESWNMMTSPGFNRTGNQKDCGKSPRVPLQASKRKPP